LQNERLAELARSDALEIGFLVAERILEQEIGSNPRALISLVRSAMRRLAESRQITVQLCPGDHARIKHGDVDTSGLASVKLEVDPALGPGDCRVVSELGQVDGRLATRLAEVRKSIESSEGEE
jgi:flagellar assembly protein FliH